tara:strand:+ start:1929 stop:2264 length:336 start_codon:yes stop_codon:yes gene_type:complete
MDYDSDSDTSDTYAEVSDEILEELKLESQLRSICIFKEWISREPEFIGINNISSQELLDILSCSNIKKSKKSLTEYQLKLFKDLSVCLFDEIYDDQYYNNVYYKICQKVYI